jgi:hypothetical protein
MVEVKLPLYMPSRHTGGLKVKFHPFLSSELDVGKRQLNGASALPFKLSSWYSWMGHTAGTNSFEKRHNLPLPEIE